MGTSALSIRKLSTSVIDKRAGRYLSFPDVVRLPSGALLVAYRDADKHFPPDPPQTEMLLAVSHDDGKTWDPLGPFPHNPREREEWAWHCPRLSLLSDGRVALVCDLAAPRKGIATLYVSVSDDGGHTWSPPVHTGVDGIVPDRIIELDPNEWIFTAHYSSPRGGPTFYQFVVATNDGGRSWANRSTISDDPDLLLCEGSMVLDDEKQLICYLRENSFIHHPTFVSFSADRGFTWSTPVSHPTHAHRPCAGFLDAQNLLITYRNVAGNPGLFAWIGQTDELFRTAGGVSLRQPEPSLGPDGLIFIGDPKAGRCAQYLVPPLSGFENDFRVEAVLRTTSESDYGCGIQVGGVLRIKRHEVALEHRLHLTQRVQLVELAKVELDASYMRKYEIDYRKPNLIVRVDERPIISVTVTLEPDKTDRRIGFGNIRFHAPWDIRYEGHEGESVWQSFRVEESGRETYSWRADSGMFPNQYQRDRCVEIEPELSGLWPESGYSGWVKLDERRIFCVDYKRDFESMPFVVGHLLELSESIDR